jgi:hypothetical protein
MVARMCLGRVDVSDIFEQMPYGIGIKWLTFAKGFHGVLGVEWIQNQRAKGRHINKIGISDCAKDITLEDS